MDTARIAALLHPFLERTLPEGSLRQISTYIDLLLRWNARINLTAVRDSEEIVTRHFGESLFLARHLFPPEPSVGRTLLSAKPSPHPRPATHPLSPDAEGWDEGLSDKSVRPTVLDIGSGAGFPGLPLKIWAPAISLTLIESNHKKAAFLREVTRALTLTDVNVITARAETLALPDKPSAPAFPPADIVTLRAVERFDALLPIAARLVSPTGRLALLIGSSQLPALQTLAPDFHAAAPIPIPQSQSRVLSILVR
ncbi:MAG: 16S rRNA (guanine(527)-N(7))-methyltransferase RsmG [Terriglobales bacterium]